MKTIVKLLAKSVVGLVFALVRALGVLRVNTKLTH